MVDSMGRAKSLRLTGRIGSENGIMVDIGNGMMMDNRIIITMATVVWRILRF